MSLQGRGQSRTQYTPARNRECTAPVTRRKRVLMLITDMYRTVAGEGRGHVTCVDSMPLNDTINIITLASGGTRWGRELGS